MIKLIGYGFLALFCLILAAGAFLFVAVPVDFVRDQMVTVVKQQTGRDLTIRGRVSFSFYPNLGVELEDVELSPPPGMTGGPTLATSSLKVDIPLLALLRQDVAIERFVLRQPVIDLRVDKAGRTSWAFGNTTQSRNRSGTALRGPTDGGEFSPELQDFLENSSENSKKSAGGSTPSLAGLSLGDVRIVDGTLRYADERSGARLEITEIDLKVALDALTAPLAMEGSGKWNGRAVPFTVEITNLDDLLKGRVATVSANIAPRDVVLRFDGLLSQRPSLRVEGALSARSEAVPQIALWLGGSAGDAGPIRQASLEGRLRADDASVALSKATFIVNDLKGSGDLEFRFSGRPRVNGRIEIASLNVDRFLGGPPSSGGGGGGGRIGALIDQDKGPDQWSGEPIDLKPLRAMDVDLRIAFRTVKYGQIKLDRGRVSVSLNRGLLEVEADPIALYGGQATGVLALDAQNSVATYNARFSADRIEALPLMKAAAGFDWISGNARMDLAVNGRGLSQRQMVRTMSGTASFDFSDGAIEGINIAQMMRGISSGQFRDFDRNPVERTDFSQLAASFQINRGIAGNRDFRLVGPFVRARGAGKVDLPNRTVSYRLTPKLVASLEGQGGGDLAGIEVPLRIEGPWANPAIYPDLQGILNNPASATAAIDSIGRALGKSKKINSDSVRGLLDGVLGGSKGETSPANDILKNLFNQ